MPIEEVVHDTDRIEYYDGYTQALLEAINLDGVSIKGYFAWSKCFASVDNTQILSIARLTGQF